MAGCGEIRRAASPEGSKALSMSGRKTRRLDGNQAASFEEIVKYPQALSRNFDSPMALSWLANPDELILMSITSRRQGRSNLGTRPRPRSQENLGRLLHGAGGTGSAGTLYGMAGVEALAARWLSWTN
ncbi:hypothetical protein TWF506_005330 [Arthrobotrys conoides]|uniref:Uncharacterized protein n=1 Tax=Arthrobotrys conoides TaxID=74498 RepID=A0AAN8RVY5_9PEZI